MVVFASWVFYTHNYVGVYPPKKYRTSTDHTKSGDTLLYLSLQLYHPSSFDQLPHRRPPSLLFGLVIPALGIPAFTGLNPSKAGKINAIPL